MAEPYNSAWFLEDVSDIAQTQYMKEFSPEYPGRFGIATNKLFKPATEEVTAQGVTVQIKVAPGDNTRATNDPLAAFPAADAFEPDQFLIRWNKQTPSSNDFTRLSASAQTTDYDIEQRGKGTIVDFVEEMVKDIEADYDEKLAIHRHIGRTGTLCLVNGTPAQNDNMTFSRCTATASNTAGLRVPVDGGSIAYLRRGSRVDFVRPATGVVVAGNIRVTDTQPGDGTTAGVVAPSVGFEFVSTGPTVRQSTGNLASVADNDIIVFSGEYNVGMYSIGAWFGRPAATGDSFMGGVNRQSAANRWLVPTATRDNVTSTTIAKSHFDDLARAMGYRDEGGMGVVFISPLEIFDKLRSVIGEDAFVQWPSNDSRLERFGQFGLTGLIYQHPTFGVVQLTGDPLATANTVRVVTTGDWLSCFYGHKGLKLVPGDKGGWYRMSESTPNSGKGLAWKCDWYTNLADFCRRPYKQGVILNVTAT